MKRLKVGIDNYGILPLGFNPLEVLEWAKANGAEGVQFSGLTAAEKKLLDTVYLKDLKQFADSQGLYLEWGGGQHIPRNTSTWEKKDIFAANQKAAETAEVLGTRVIRSCSGGLMRWNKANPITEELLQEMAHELRAQKNMLRDLNAILALETHFEFTTHELLRLFDMCDTQPGEYLGICLDTMNLLTMLEDPATATKRVLPWIVSTHIKDGGILFAEQGFLTFPTEIGQGSIDLNLIIKLLMSLPQEINLSVEDHGGSFSVPVYDPEFLGEFPDLSLSEFVALTRLAVLSRKVFPAGKAAVTPRSKWPDICAARMTRNIQTLKNLAEAAV